MRLKRNAVIRLCRPCWSLQGIWIGVKYILKDLPGGSAGKESTCNAGDPSSITGLGGSPGEGNSYPLQYSGLGNSMDRGAWQATVHGFTKSWTRLSHFNFHIIWINQKNIMHCEINHHKRTNTVGFH